jgi:hypothetical protein
MRTLTVLLALAVLGFPTAASAAVSECGDPPGAAHNVTAVGVSCADARGVLAQGRRPWRHQQRHAHVAGWRSYKATVRRVGGEYDVRATRGRKVIRFQYRSPGSDGSRDCDPNYEGACLDPDSPDYDCAGGSGNGPDYTGPVRVVGDDPHGLDGDGDGYGCEG